MALLLTTSWQIEGEKVDIVTDFLYLSSKITADGDCSHEIRRWLFLGRRAITNLDSVLKSRDITLPTKVHIVKAMVFPVVTYGCEGCKEGIAPKNWCFWTVVLEKILKVPWTARRSNQSILREGISILNTHWKDWCWSWSPSILVIWCKEPTYWKCPWCWERLKAGEESIRGWDGWMASLVQRTWTWANQGDEGHIMFFTYFIFGCAGSSVLSRLSRIVVSRDCSSLQCLGFSLRWLLLLRSMGSRAHRLQ